MATNRNNRRRTLDTAVATRKTPAKAAPAPARRRLSDAPAGDKVDELKQDEVLAIIPRGFRLTIDHHHHVDYAAGTRTMPRDHFEHWWSKANGVKDANSQEAS